MTESRIVFTSPSLSGLRWLADPGRNVPADIKAVLLGEIFASPKAVIVGVVNGLLVNIVALCMSEGWIFGLFILLDVALAAVRVKVVQRAFTNAAKGLPTPTDLYFLTAGAWCALQGAMAFSAMRTGNLTLGFLAGGTVLSLIGPISARNYSAPRYAMALVLLCYVPFIAGAALSGYPWLLVLLLQAPLFLFGVRTIVLRFQTMAVATLVAERDSYKRARHDALTGLLNRFGLTEALDRQSSEVVQDTVLFYLDLDGFKPINDTYGHQVGDLILQAVARRLSSCMREGDLLSRLGGDEFVVVARRLSSEDGARYAEALIHAIAGSAFTLPDLPPLRVGISVGSAASPQDGSQSHDLHRKADLALYDAKRAGRGVHRRFTEALSPAPLAEVGLARAS